jgi:hypothetical protein
MSNEAFLSQENLASMLKAYESIQVKSIPPGSTFTFVSHALDMQKARELLQRAFSLLGQSEEERELRIAILKALG